MKQNLELIGLIVLCVGVLFLTSCNGNRILMIGNPPVEYTFLDYQTSCTEFSDINLSDLEGYCNNTFRPAYMGVDDINNSIWSIICCSFNDQCFADNCTNTTVGVEGLCSVPVANLTSMSTIINTTLGLRALCTASTGLTWVDSGIDLLDNLTICDGDSNTIMSSFFSNVSSWEVVCCKNP